MNRTQKLIIAFLGLALLILGQVLVNIYVLNGDRETTLMTIPIWFIIYFTYSQLVINKI